MAFNVDAAYAISWFYAASFGRTPVPNSALPDNGDLGGLTFWTDVFLDGQDAFSQFKGDVYAIADFFVASDEFLARYPLELSNSQFVTQLYNNMLDRDPDLAGFNFWVGRLDAGDSRGTILADFANTTENQDSNPTRKAALENFILFIANDDDGTITPDEGGAWIVANPTLNGAVVDGEPPVATADTDTTIAGNPVTLDVLVNDISYNGALTLESVTAATQGTAEIVDGKIVYTTGTGAAAVGEQTFDYTIKDGGGHTATATVTVNVTNTAPEAVADTAETLAETPVVISVLANDIDVDGHTLTIASTTTPLNGTVEVVDAVDGQVVNYTPNADFSGTDQFTYTIDDGYGGTSTATATVTVAAPTTGINLTGPTEATEGSDATYTATLSAAVASVVTVAYAITFTGEATAADLEDGTPLTGTLTFAAGTLEQMLDIGVKFDTETEATGGIVVTLSSPTGGAVLGDSTSVATDLLDPPPATYTLSSSAVAGVPTEEGQTVTFTVTPDSIVTEDTTLVFNLSGAVVGAVTEQATGADFNPATKTFTFLAGTTTAQTVAISVVSDGTVEQVEGYQARLLDASSNVVGNVVTGLISDGVAVGQTFTLTTNTDNIVGTNGNDTIIGDVGTTVTVQGSDQINGGAGTDTYKIFGAFTAGTSPTGTVTNVETLFIEKFADAAQNFSSLTKAATGIESIVIGDASPITGEIVTTTAGQSLSLATGTAGVAMGAGSLTWAGSATDTSLNLTLNGFQGGTGVTPIGLTVTGAAATTLNIASTGAANKVGAQGATWLTGPLTVTKHVVSGDKALTYVLAAADAAALNSIDASASTGGVSANVAAGTAKAAFAFTGGSGNDAAIFADNQFTTLTSGTQLNGGAGTGDKIGLYDTVSLTATEYGKINAATNFEVLGINAALTVDGASLTSIKHFSLDTDAAQAFTNLKTGSIVDLPVAHAGTLGIATAVGVNDVTINVGTSTTAGLAIAGTVTVGATVVALTSNGTNVTANTIATLANADNSVITITGSNDLTITAALAATATGSKVDASAFTGKLSVVGNTTNYVAGSGLGDVLIGGSAADTIKASENSATLTGNGGNDTFNVEVAPAAAITSMVITTITDFTKGDKIDFAATAGAFTAAAVNLAAAVTEAAAIDLLVAGSNSDLKWGVYNGNTYIVEDLGAGATIDATDTIVKLTGVLDLSTSTLSATVLTFA